MAYDDAGLALAAARALADATIKLGSSLRDDGAVAMGWGELLVRPLVLRAEDAPEGGVALALGFEVMGPALASPLRDVSAGVAPSAEEAIQFGLHAFLGGPLAVLHDALSDFAVPYRYAISVAAHDTEDNVEWSVFEGPLQIGGDAAAREQLQKTLMEKPLFVRLAEAKTLPRLPPGNVHWLRLHAARDGNEAAYSECVFDGGVWPEGQGVVARFEWPSTQGPQTFRQYWLFTAN